MGLQYFAQGETSQCGKGIFSEVLEITISYSGFSSLEVATCSVIMELFKQPIELSVCFI